jgi:hypothetical protein
MKYYEAKDQNIRLFYPFLKILRIINILKKTDVKSYDSRAILMESIQALRSFRHISNLTKLKLFYFASVLIAEYLLLHLLKYFIL